MDTLDLLRRLVQVPSENGREADVAAVLAASLREAGVQTRVSEVAPGRANLYAWTGAGPAAGILLVGHLDVVPAGPGWSRPPFEPALENGRMYGRGTADMKGAVAAMAGALARVARERPGVPAAAVFVADEEGCNAGMKAYLADGAAPRAPHAVLGEPTGLAVCLGHKGVSLWRLATAGTPGHTAVVAHPDSAIWKMGRLLVRLEVLAEELRRRADPRLGPMSLNVGTIQGGTAHNVVPGSCEATLDRRVFPGDTLLSVEAELRRHLAGARVGYDLSPFLYLEPSWVERESPVARAAGAAVSAVLGRAAQYGPFPATCEAGYLSSAGIPTVILGPGHLEQAHVADEYVDVDQVLAAKAIYTNIVQGGAAP